MQPYTAAPGAPPMQPYGIVALPSPFAGFWLRLVAALIDSILVLAGLGVIALVVFAFVGLGFFRSIFENPEGDDGFFVAAFMGTIFMVWLLMLVGAWLYNATMESSIHQGTLGKMALGLIVTDLQGRRVTFGRASGRHFSKLITGLIPLALGYIMAGFTEKKQALHDMIASCLVLRKN